MGRTEDLGTADQSAVAPEEIQATASEDVLSPAPPEVSAVQEPAVPVQEPQTPAEPAAASVSASDEGLPPVILSGLDAYTLEGAEAAIKAWIKGGPNESDTTLPILTETFSQVEKTYGRYLGYEVISVKNLTASSKLIYLQMNYEKGPFFCRFLCYKHAESWIVSGRLAFDTDPQKIMVLDPVSRQ